MAFQLREVDRAKIYSSIVDQLVEGIRSGAFPPGTALPPERRLADQLAVSRSSVREAVRVLEHSGVLDVRTGSGTYVTKLALSKATLLRVEAATAGEHSPLDIIAARRALEPTCAALAAQHRSHNDLVVLRSMLEAQAQQVEMGGDPTEADLKFHLLIGGATHNTLLRVLMEQIVDVMHQQMWRAMKLQSLADRGRAGLYVRQHRDIYAYIESGESELATSAMGGHLDSVEAGLLDHLS